MEEIKKEEVKFDYDKYIDEAEMLCIKDNLASSTTTGKLRALIKIFSEVVPLTPENFKAWLKSYRSERTDKPLGPHGKNRYIKALKWYLKRTKLIPDAEELYKNMDIKCEMPSSPGKVISQEEFEEILQYAPDELHELAFRLIFEAGFRPHELLSIRFRDISTDEGRIDWSGKGGVERPTILYINLPDTNPVTPSGRNKTGGRPVPIYKNIDMLMAISREKLQEKGGDTDKRLFPFGHKHFSSVFSRMKKKYARVKSIPVDTDGGDGDKRSISYSDDAVNQDSNRKHGDEEVATKNGRGSKNKNKTENKNNSKISAGRGGDNSNPPENTGGASIRLRHGGSMDMRRDKPSFDVKFGARLYDLRHSAITKMYAQGLNDQTIRRIVGWRPSSKMPDTYVHIEKKQITSALRNIINQNNTFPPNPL